MAVTYTNAVKDSMLAAVVTALGTAGKLEIGTAAMAATLVTFTLSNPAGTPSAGVLTFSFVSATVAATGTGTAAAARMRTSGDTDIITGLTCGTGSEDIVFDNASIAASQNVTMNSATLTKT